MEHADDTRRKFRNRRQWRDVIAAACVSAALPCAVTYPTVIGALRSGRAWFIDGAVRVSRWRAASLGPVEA
jgi:hypothetical protein